jgi:hypothetical protein
VHAAKNLGVKKGGRGAKTLLQQLLNNSADVQQQQKRSMRLYVHSGKLILTAMYLRRARINSRSYAAAPTQDSTVVTPLAPAAQNLGVSLRRPCSADVKRKRVNISDFICTETGKESYYLTYLTKYKIE